MATLFVDFENGNENYAGTSFNLLASGTNGRISSTTFSSATANFPNDGTLCNTKNMIASSERLFDTSAFSFTQTSITKVNITPPSGVDANVYSLIDNNVSSTHSINNNITYTLTTSTTYTISLYAKANGRNEIVIRFQVGSNANIGIRYNLSTGTISQSGANATGTITSVGDGWYRLTLTGIASISNQAITIGLTNDSYNSTDIQTYVGDGVSGVYLCGLQLEAGSTATSYEKSPTQYLSIFNGTIYAVYEITQYLSSTSLFIKQVSGGTSLSNQTVDRQYYIGGRWKTLRDGATATRLMENDTVRIMGSPNPTSVGNATWTGQRTPLSVAITSSSNTSPIQVSCASTMSALGISTGDIVTIAGHLTNTNANGTWVVTVPNPAGSTLTLNGSTGNGVGSTGRLKKKTNSVVQLASAVTANIASFGNRGEGRTGWVASSGVIASLVADDTKEGDVSDSIDIALAFTTGKAAYKPTGTLDLSGYQQLSFWIKQTGGTLALNGDISLRLCSDALGDTAVHTFNIEGLVVLGQWTPITIDLGSNMSSSIQSIALYVNTDRGNQTFFVSNIIACKASSSDDSLNLCSLIGKNTTDEPWFPIMSINGTRVMLAAGSAYNPSTNFSPTASTDAVCERGYYGISETVNTFKRETIKTPLVSTSTASNSFANLLQAGTASLPVTYSFGWDRTSMTTQNLVTYLDGRNNIGTGLYTTLSYQIVNKLGVVRYSTGISFLGSGSGLLGSTFDFEWAIGCSVGYNINNVRRCIFNTIYGTSCGNTSGTTYGTFILNSNSNIFNKIVFYNFCGTNNGILQIDDICNINIFSNLKLFNGSVFGLVLSDSTNNIFTNGLIEGCYTDAIRLTSSNNNIFKSINMDDNNSGIVLYGGDAIFQNCIIDQAIETANQDSSNSRIYLINHDNVANNNFIATDGGLIVRQVTVRNTNSGYAWAMSPTSTNRDSSYPLDLKVATIGVAANSPVTVKAWVRRTNILLTMGLRIKGGQIAGVSSDITSYMTAAADTWQQITLTFTPTEVGVVEILAECYGGTTYTGYIDDLTITQA